MTQKQLEKLSRRRLLELLAEQTGRADRLERENSRLKERIADREQHLKQLGRVAEAILYSRNRLNQEQLEDVSGYLSEVSTPEEEEEEPDSEATDGESRAPLPRRRSRALRLMPDDDEDGNERDGECPPLIPKKDRTGLVPRGSTPAPRRSANAPPTPEPLEVNPSSRLSGFKFGRRLLEPANDDQ